jgi:UDP-N-acetylglucosamine 2-epimerase (non-hydrolysing)
MPEEINRLVTDAIADLLWTPSADADENLLREGVPKEKIDFIGNIMIDSFELLRSKIEQSNSRRELGLSDSGYAVMTLHRPSNVDDPQTLEHIVDTLDNIASEIHIVFAAHPRTVKNLKTFDLYDRLTSIAGIQLLEPLPYIDFMNVVIGAKMVITDSGGLQEETTYLSIPCLTMRENTERPITVTQGTNRLVGIGELLPSVNQILAGDWPKGSCPPLWDGKTAQRAVASLEKRLFD